MTLPQGYRQLEYIQSDGASLIDTGVYPHWSLAVKVTFCHASAESVVAAERQFVFGTYNRSNAAVVSRVQLMNGGSAPVSGGSTHSGICGWGGAYRANVEQETPVAPKTVIADASGFRFEGEASFYTPTSQSFENEIPIFLFACNEEGTAGHFSNGLRIFRAVFDLDGDIVSDLVPCERESDGAVGMIDITHGVFHANAGTGTFVKGEMRIANLLLQRRTMLTFGNGDQPGEEIPIGVNLFDPTGPDARAGYISASSADGTAPIWTGSTSYSTQYFPYNSDYTFTITGFLIGSAIRIFAVDADGLICGAANSAGGFQNAVKAAEASLGKKAVGAYIGFRNTSTNCEYMRTA